MEYYYSKTTCSHPTNLSHIHLIQQEEDVEHELAGGKTTRFPGQVGTLNGTSGDSGESGTVSLLSLVSMSTRHIGHRLLDDNHWSMHST